MGETNNPLPVVILISGNGSNLQAIIDTVNNGQLAIDIRAVISNRPTAYGLQRAQQAGIPAEVVDHTSFACREDFDRALQACIDQHQPELVILAGFMRLLSADFVNHYQGRMLNIHPSLLPAFKGIHTHQRAFEAFQSGKISEHGVSIHFVTSELDGGPVIAQAAFPLQADDSVESLAARALTLEHKTYPIVIGWFANQRLSLPDHQVWLDGEILQQPVSLETNNNKH